VTKKRPKESPLLRAVRKRIRASFWANFDKKTKKKEAKKTFSEDLRKTIVVRRRKPTKTPSDIQAWLAFLDEVIGFWFLTWAFYRERIDNSKKPIPNQLVCLMTLAGRVFQDMICIRELTESGFFVQSNVVASSFDRGHRCDAFVEYAAAVGRRVQVGGNE